MELQLETRQKIIQKAQEAFFQFGFKKVTVDEIAEGLGMSKKTIYNHFSGKEALLYAVIDSTRNDFDQELQIMEGKTQGNYWNEVVGKVQVMSQWLARMSLFIKDLQRHVPNAFKLLTSYKNELAFSNCSKLIDKGIRLGLIKNSGQSRFAILAYLVAIERMLSPNFKVGLPEDYLDVVPDTNDKLSSDLLEIIYQGIKK